MCTYTFEKTEITAETAGVPPLSNKPERVLFFTCERWDHLSLSSLHTVSSHSHYRPSSYFKAALLLSAVCFAHRPGGGAEGEARKPPLAAQAEGDRFTNPDWNTTINYGTPRIKVGRIEPARPLIKAPNSITATRLNIQVCVGFLSTSTSSFSVHLRSLTLIHHYTENTKK